jgi:dTDP-4-amino-4,6-dideoxygalactose transaminase
MKGVISVSSDQAVPFLDLIAPHHELRDELTEVFHHVLATAGFIGGPVVEEFEHHFGAFCQAEYSVGVGSGTDALRFALIAAGVCPGDSVITVANTFIATTEAISQAGAVPEFVDVDESSSNMDPAKLREFLDTQCFSDELTGRLISHRTRRPVSAIVPVHLYGQMADMDQILAIANANNLIVIEDACQAHGAEYFSKAETTWKRAGSMGHAAAFSFYPGKNLGACGEAGAVTTNAKHIAQKVKMLRDHGQDRKYYHQMEGYNGRLDALQAGLMTVKLKHLERWNQMRRAKAVRYAELLAPYAGNIDIPQTIANTRSVYHLYVLRANDREALRTRLSECGIGTGIHYPIPLHLQHAYRFLGYRQHDFPVTERLAKQILSLPMFPQLTEEQQVCVAGAIGEFVTARSLTAESAKAATEAVVV